MPATFLLFLLMMSGPAFALVALGTSVGLLIFSRRKRLGIAILGSGILGGLSAVGFVALVAHLLRFNSTIENSMWFISFYAGFGYLGCSVAVVGIVLSVFGKTTPVGGSRWQP